MCKPFILSNNLYILGKKFAMNAASTILWKIDKSFSFYKLWKKKRKKIDRLIKK